MSNKLNRDEKFDGKISNQEVITINKELSLLNDQIRTRLKRLLKIQDECDHHYQFDCSSMHTDFYKCNKCGYEREQ